jgi:hypothetical protein
MFKTKKKKHKKTDEEGDDRKHEDVPRIMKINKEAIFRELQSNKDLMCAA